MGSMSIRVTEADGEKMVSFVVWSSGHLLFDNYEHHNSVTTENSRRV
jgi:hypothetical protein